MLVGAAPGTTDEAGRMGVIDEHHGVIRFGQSNDLCQLSHVAIHGEDTVSDDHAKTFVTVLRQFFLQVSHIGMLVRVLHGLAQAHSVHNGGVY
jgi:hypothetical protein